SVLVLNVAITSQLGQDPRSVPLDETDFVGETYRSARLDLGSAAVNEQFDTRDETGVIRSEKQRHLSNFLGFPHASHRDGGHNPRNHVCSLPSRQRRIDRTRDHNVDRIRRSISYVVKVGKMVRMAVSVTVLTTNSGETLT